MVAGGRCALGQFGGAPSFKTCAVACPVATAEAKAWALDQARRNRTDPGPRLPDPGEIAQNFGQAMARWTAAGFPTVTREVYQRRTAICQGDDGRPKCEHWKPGKLPWSGRCRKCGCTKLKHWLATERCPVGKWA